MEIVRICRAILTMRIYGVYSYAYCSAGRAAELFGIGLRLTLLCNTRLIILVAHLTKYIPGELSSSVSPILKICLSIHADPKRTPSRYVTHTAYYVLRRIPYIKSLVHHSPSRQVTQPPMAMFFQCRFFL